MAAILSACGQLQTATETPAASVVAGTPTAAETSAGTPTVAATAAASPTPIPGLTDTGYKAPDGTPLYKECVGTDPLTGKPLPLPPVYPTPGGARSPLPPPPANPNPNPRPADADLPSFDVLSVTPSDASAWPRISTPCAGGLSFALPPGFEADHAFDFGDYQQQSGGIYYFDSNSVKMDIDYAYDTDDTLTRFRNAEVGNGVYVFERNKPVEIGGAAGLLDVSTGIIDSPKIYLVISILVVPRPGWYLSAIAFVLPPFTQNAVADALGTIQSFRFAP